MSQIIDPIPYPIGMVGTSSNMQYTGMANSYDVTIAGQPFFLATTQQYPYKRETAPYRRTQIDQTREPGEQTLLGWWLRSQSSFHLGSGVKYEEPVQGDSVEFRFWKSAGVDPWTIGRVSLLNDVTKSALTVTNPIAVSGRDANGVDLALVADGANLYRVLVDGTYAALSWGGTGTILSLTTDGLNYYVANSTGVYSGPNTGASAGTLLFSWPTAVSHSSMGWVKQRLIATGDTKIWQIIPGAAAPTTPIYTHPISGWVWTSVVDGPNSVYVSGYAGLSSSVFKLSLDTSGNIPTLTNAVTVADLPGGEIITGMATYVGKFIALGTNRGVRVGTIDTTGYFTSGQITYGPLSVIINGYDPVYQTTWSGQNVTGFAFNDRFLFATVSNRIDNGDGTFSSGLVRIDLSRELGGGLFAWATDLRTMTTGTVNSVANIGFSGKKLIAGTDGVFVEASTLVASGYMDTGQIRYLTLEDKHFKLLKPRFIRPMSGTANVYSILADGTTSEIMTVTDSVDPTADVTTGITTPQESVGFRFQLLRDATSGLSPVFTGYQLKALPAVKRARLLTIPVMCYDWEEDRNNVMTGYEGWAADKIQRLETVEAAGDTVIIQDFTVGAGETVQAVIETLQFVRISPPERRYKGFGGVLYVTARTV